MQYSLKTVSYTHLYCGLKTQPTIEGPKVYKRNGYYYIFAPAGGVKEAILAAEAQALFVGQIEVEDVYKRQAYANDKYTLQTNTGDETHWVTMFVTGIAVDISDNFAEGAQVTTCLLYTSAL